jgi:predicted DsbA family dithiol-disulfide isomerase
MNKLPMWKEWTIDMRLKQFRRVGKDGALGIEFVDFDSDDGKRLMIEYCEEQKEYYQELGDGYQRMIFDLEEDMTDSDTLESIAEEMGGEND